MALFALIFWIIMIVLLGFMIVDKDRSVVSWLKWFAVALLGFVLLGGARILHISIGVG